jgi:hypothetical protein
MTLRFRRCALVLSMSAMISLVFLLGPGNVRSAAAPEQQSQTVPNHPEEETRLPNGKLQRDEILKAEHQQNLKDAAQLVELSEQLREDIEKNDRYVLSVSTLKKTDDIEKLVKKIRSRMRHN